MHSLPVFLRLRDAPVILVGTGPMADAKRRLLERAGARVVGEDAQDARVAFIAIDDAAGKDVENAARRLKARGLLLNVADRPELCDLTLPAIVDRDPVLVAIGTGGVSAGLAAALRQRLEALLPADLGSLAIRLRGVRADLATRVSDAGERRRMLGAAMAPDGPLDPLAPSADHDTDIAGAAPARIERIAITSADPDELTLRAARLLGQADRLYHPAGMAAAVLDRARADAERIEGAPPAAPPPGLSLDLAWSRP